MIKLKPYLPTNLQQDYMKSNVNILIKRGDNTG